jgi:Zn-finger nucleic acid-binding protein
VTSGASLPRFDLGQDRDPTGEIELSVDTQSSVKILVACPGCKRQYEAGGLAAGSRFHCNCGQAVAVPATRVFDAAVVRCSSCSAPRARGAQTCGHCGADFTLHERDLHTICPQCMARISDRARFCHHCATPILPQGKAGRPTDLECPVCGKTHALNSRKLGKQAIAILECPACAGLWLGRQAFERIAERARTTASGDDPLLTAASPTDLRAARTRQRGALYRRCPECRQMMHRRNFGRRSGVIVDTCKEHGLWFDADELERILRWIREGGEQRARRRIAEEQSEPSRVDRFIDDRLERLAGRGTRSRHPFAAGRGSDDGFGGLLGALFDL